MKASLGAYIAALFGSNPGLAFHPLVVDFFQMEELGIEAAILTSVKTAEFDKRHRHRGHCGVESSSSSAADGSNTALIAPSLGPYGSSSVAEGGGYVNPRADRREEVVYNV